MRRGLLALCALLCLPELAAASNAAGPSFGGYNLILISLGNVGAQHMSLYGYARKTTPRLDRWAGGGIVFENAFSPASWTLPVAASLFTSLAPFSHRIINRYVENSLAPEIKTLPEVLRAAGYRTAAFTGGLDYYSDFSTMRGFEEKPINPNFSGYDLTLRQAKSWLAGNSKKKFFLFVHGYDAHCPFTPPPSVRGTFSALKPEGVSVDHTLCVRGVWSTKREGFDAYYAGGCTEFPRIGPCRKNAISKPSALAKADIDFLRDLYDEEVLSVDGKIADFLASLDKAVLAKTLIVVFSEHGEMFAKHGRFGRAGTSRGTLYDDVIHVPLMMRLPSVAARRVAGAVELGDLAPTLAGLLGVRLPHRLEGKDLRPLIFQGLPAHDSVFAGLSFARQMPPFDTLSVSDCVRSRGWKLIREKVLREGRWRLFKNSIRRLLGRPAPPFYRETLELYDLAADPQELVNLAASRPERVRSLVKALDGWRARSASYTSRAPRTQKLPPLLLEQAKKHGYW